MLTTKFPNSVLHTATMLVALTVSPLLSAQPVMAPEDASPEESVAGSVTPGETATASPQAAQVRAGNADTPAINDDVLTVDAAGASSIESSGNIRIATFRDSVRFRQGLIEILGDTARLEQDIVTGDLIKITVEGDPARFTRDAQDSVDTITGHSESIVYYNETLDGTLLSVVEFIGNASFNRGRTSFECTQIKHIIETGATDSPGPCSGLLAPTSQTEQPASQPDNSEN